MTIVRRSGAVAAVLLFVVGWLLVFAGPAAANPDPPPDDTSSGDTSSGDTSSGGCGSGCGGHHEPKSDDSDAEPEEPRVLVLPGQPAPPPRAPTRRPPAAPAAPADPGADFVPALPPGPPRPLPVLEQTATSRGPALLTPSGPATDDGAGPSEWLVPALVTAAAGVALALVPGRREPEPPAGEFAGPAGRFAQPALGGMVNAGPPDGDPRKPPIDVKQHAWDWGGHYLGGAVILVPAVLGAPVTAKLVVAGVVIALASELKRRLWPSKPLTVNDMVGGNPYERLQKSGNDGLGQKVRDGHGGAEVRKELGPDGNQTTTWGQGTQGVHQETGGQTSGRGDAYRDAIK